MTAPNLFGVRQRRFRLPEEDFGLDPRRFDEAMAVGDQADAIDRTVTAPPRRPGLLGSLAEGLAYGLASETNPDARGLEAFLGGAGRGFVGQRQREAEAAAQQAEQEAMAQKLKGAMLGQTMQQRRLDLDNRRLDLESAPYNADTDPDVLEEEALRTRGLGRYYNDPTQPPRREGFTLGRSRYEYDATGRPRLVATAPEDGGDGLTRSKPGSPEHRQAWVLNRMRQLRRADSYGEIPLTAADAQAAAEEEYDAQYPPPPSPAKPGFPAHQGSGRGVRGPLRSQPLPAVPTGRGGAPAAPNLDSLRAAAEAQLKAEGRSPAEILQILGPP